MKTFAQFEKKIKHKSKKKSKHRSHFLNAEIKINDSIFNDFCSKFNSIVAAKLKAEHP